MSATKVSPEEVWVGVRHVGHLISIWCPLGYYWPEGEEGSPDTFIQAGFRTGVSAFHYGGSKKRGAVTIEYRGSRPVEEIMAELEEAGKHYMVPIPAVAPGGWRAKIARALIGEFAG